MPPFRDIDMQELRDPTKKDVDLANAGLFDRDMDVIIRELTDHPREVNLDISVNNFRPDTIRKLANSGIEFESLDLTKCNVNAPCFMALLSAKNIRRLSISYSGCCLVDIPRCWNYTILQPQLIALCNNVVANTQQIELNVEGTLLADKWLPEEYRGKIAAKIAQNRERHLREQLNSDRLPDRIEPPSKMSEPSLKRHFANGNHVVMDAALHSEPTKQPKPC